MKVQKLYTVTDLLGYSTNNLTDDEVLKFVKQQLPLSPTRMKKLKNALANSSKKFEYTIEYDGCEIKITNSSEKSLTK